MAAAALAGCSDNGAVPGKGMSSTSGLPAAVAKAKQENTAVNPAIVNADNAFGLSVLQALQQQDATANITISPLSLSIAFQVLYNGAARNTQDAMAKTLQLGSLTKQQINDANAALQASLTDADPQVELKTANSLWMHLNNNPVLTSFIQTNQNYYGSEIGDLAGAPDNVNAWVAKQTNGLIPSIIGPDDYSRIVAVIANAVYFKGQWTTKFDPNDTHSESFTSGDGTSVTVKMMHQSGQLAYLRGADFQMVRLPYGQGRLSMLIVLPGSARSLGSFLTGVTADGMNTWVSQMRELDGDVALPKFSAQSKNDLGPVLKTLGMGVAFNCWGDLAASADFTNLVNDTRGICITSAQHNAWIQVDEMGTVAAAATGIKVGTTSVRVPQFTMTMDHPFLFAIRDDDTGELLFIGTMLNPSR